MAINQAKHMMRYIIVGIVSGILLGILDGVINGNSFAQQLFDVYKPIARTSLNLPAGLVIDLVYGFVMAGVFLLLYDSLPGGTGVVKGIGFAFLIWFFRVVMYGASQWMMLNVPLETLLYILLTGLGEMLILGLVYGLSLKPHRQPS